MNTEFREVTKEEWEQLRRDIIQQARKLSHNGDCDTEYFYSPYTIVSWKLYNLTPGAKIKYPKGHSRWTIRHFSPIDCSITDQFATTSITCLLRSPDGKHYVSEHLPGFCPIHDLIPAYNKKKTKEIK